MRKDLPKTRAVQVLRFGAARIRSLTLAITRRFFAGIARCAGFLLTLAAVRIRLLALAAVRIRLLAFAAIRLLLPHCAQSQQTPSSQRRKPANPPAPCAISACATRAAADSRNAIRAESDDVGCGLTEFKKENPVRNGVIHSMVGRQGFEPWTLGLRVPCSAS